MRHMFDIVKNQNPLMLPPSTPVQQACRSMRNRRVGAVLVTAPDGRLLGIFSGRDAVGRVLAEGKDAAKTMLAEVITPEPHTIPPAKVAIECANGAKQDCGRAQKLSQRPFSSGREIEPVVQVLADFPGIPSIGSRPV